MQAHGELTLRWIGNILHAQAEGMFNEEGTLAAVLEHREVVLAARKRCWGQLEVWGPETLGTPEALAHIGRAYRWSAEQGCLAVAVVASNSIQEGIVEGLVPLPVAFFVDEAEAMVWLQEQLDAQDPFCT